MKILLIDDEESMHVVLKGFLEPEPDTELLYCDNLHDGIETIKRGGIDVAVVDLRYPNWGQEKTLIRLPEITRDVCVLVWTGYDDGKKELWVECVKAGACNYLQKKLYLSSREMIIHAITNSLFVFKYREMRAKP